MTSKKDGDKIPLARPEGKDVLLLEALALMTGWPSCIRRGPADRVLSPTLVLCVSLGWKDVSWTIELVEGDEYPEYTALSTDGRMMATEYDYCPYHPQVQHYRGLCP